MKLWSDFYDSALPELPGCPFVALNHALRQSAIAFCEQSLVWTYEHPDISIVAGVDEYAYIPPAETLVHAVTWAKFNETELDTRTRDEDMRIWDWRNQTGVPQYVLNMPNSLKLVPKPDLDGTLKLIVALKPDNSAIGIDDVMFQEHREAIAHGAKARLMLSPRKPYTDPERAVLNMQMFNSKVLSAGVRASRNYTLAPLRTAIMNRR
jgi:hypothetical protein